MTEQLTPETLNQQIRCVSHEIRNHLSICDMYSQIIRKNLEKSQIENASIENAIDCIQNSLKIIGANLLDLKSAYTTEKDISFNIFIKNSADIQVDENKFLACIVNIIKNGIEAIETCGKIEILAEIKNDYAILKISNNGKPIPKDKQKNIFNQGYTTKKTGCGLGLSICKKNLAEQNATLELTKSLKNCTQFEIKVPVFS